ncbi:hypothetical protein LSTR_LSTR012231 [Laodelphax striatellus]|uniref:Aldose 1-epimerase n=1 Tax=Laodelphax striatellus TaxID=195883 RepID=A0A482WS33_LAOST|nr:hypothetical protein LSTR_LSTR012231 [Laodelphax striatellus]
MDLMLYSACIVALLYTIGCSEASVSEDVFGHFSDPDSGVNHTVRRFTIQNDNNFTVQLINFGATLTGLRMPDKNGVVDDVVLGFDKVESYNNALNPYFGATVGRVANRIRGGTFKLDGTTYQLFKNAGNDTLHGGKRGFSRVIWEAESRPDNNQVVMRYVSANGSEGFPGDVNAEATFTLLATGPQSSQLVITYKAATNQRTPINIVNHAYFNLAGHRSGKDGIYRHKVRINADKYTVLDNTLVPTGEIADVNSTVYDLRNTTVVGDAIKNSSSDGIDINFCIIIGTNGLYLRDTAYIVDEESGRFLELATDQPGVQFYTHNNDNDFTGKEGVVYKRHGAFCLETQNYPDAVNHDNFPNSIFEPGKLYSHTSSYVFGILTK